MTNSQNGWPLLAKDSPLLHTWVIPAKNGTFKLRIRNGSAGFLLAHYAQFHSEKIEDVTGKILDDWGYAPRPIRGSTVPSNHGSGTAIDLNAVAHGLGREGTFGAKDVAAIHARLRWMQGTIRWGGDYIHREDAMHFEIVQGMAAVEHLARKLSTTPRGKAILAKNPGQRKVIFS